jgi:hypothetical protein
MPFEIAETDHIVRNCADVDTTAEWYRKALGLSVQPLRLRENRRCSRRLRSRR